MVASERFMLAICACRRSQISAVRHRPSAALPSARCVSSAVGVATFGSSSSTPIPDTGWCTVSSPQLASNPAAG